MWRRLPPDPAWVQLDGVDARLGTPTRDSSGQAGPCLSLCAGGGGGAGQLVCINPGLCPWDVEVSLDLGLRSRAQVWGLRSGAQV